jgi:hypothetical protein
MGTFRVFIKDLLDSGASVTIHCYCLRTSQWSNEQIAKFPATLRLWNVTQDYRCAGCGRIGMVRHIDIHTTVERAGEHGRQAEHIRRAVPIRGKPAFGKRQRVEPKRDQRTD